MASTKDLPEAVASLSLKPADKLMVQGNPTTWEEQEFPITQYEEAEWKGSSYARTAKSKYNPTPGSGRVGFMPIPPNNYPFYNDDEKYVPIVQADGGICSVRLGLGEFRPTSLSIPTTQWPKVVGGKSRYRCLRHIFVCRLPSLT